MNDFWGLFTGATDDATACCGQACTSRSGNKCPPQVVRGKQGVPGPSEEGPQGATGATGPAGQVIPEPSPIIERRSFPVGEITMFVIPGGTFRMLINMCGGGGSATSTAGGGGAGGIWQWVAPVAPSGGTMTVYPGRGAAPNGNGENSSIEFNIISPAPSSFLQLIAQGGDGAIGNTGGAGGSVTAQQDNGGTIVIAAGGAVGLAAPFQHYAAYGGGGGGSLGSSGGASFTYAGHAAPGGGGASPLGSPGVVGNVGGGANAKLPVGATGQNGMVEVTFWRM